MLSSLAMNEYVGVLSSEETEVLAGVRLATTVHSMALASRSDPYLRAKALAKPFSLVLSAPGLAAAGISTRGGAIRAWSGGAPPRFNGGYPSLVLRFSSPRSAARTLGGGGGLPLPIPLGPGALAALSYFRAAAARVPVLLRESGTDPGLKAAVLAEAALRGLAAVASSDSSLDERMAHVPDGSVAVEAAGAFSIGLVKSGRRIEILEAAPERPNARLLFRDAAAAIAVLTGARQAVVALGAREVTIGGLLPLVQGLFAVLDRLGAYMAVKNEEPKA